MQTSFLGGKRAITVSFHDRAITVSFHDSVIFAAACFAFSMFVSPPMSSQKIQSTLKWLFLSFDNCFIAGRYWKMENTQAI